MEFDFTANTTVDDPQLVPEEFRGIYVEKDGAHTIAPQYLPLANLAGGLQKSLKASREEIKTARGKTVDLSPLSEFGEEPVSIATTVKAKISELTEQLSKGLKLDPEKIRAEIKASFDAQIVAKDGELAAMSGTLNQHLVASEAVRAIAAEKGVPELLMPHINSQVKVVRNGQTYSVAVVDKDGDARISGVTGQPMTIPDLVKEMKSNAVFGRAFESESAGGSGTPPGSHQRRQTPPPSAQTANMSALQKIEAGLNARR